MTDVYGAGFFAEVADGALRSAEAVVPIVLQLLAPTSVLDVGCGTGAWVDAFRRHGVRDVFGIDGFSAAARAHGPDVADFATVNLNGPFALARRYDLVVSLEVAEHLAPSSAECFVGSLAAHADAVLFSAALPGQRGRGHVHEQWLEYWAAVFDDLDFVCFDAIRPRIWHRADVEFWYRQNIVLFIRRRAHDLIGRLRSAGCEPAERVLSLVHPELLRLYAVEIARPSPYRALRRLLKSIAISLGIVRAAPFSIPPYPPASDDRVSGR